MKKNISHMNYHKFRSQQLGYYNIDDVLFITGLMENLISVSVMEDRGYAIELKNKKVLIILKEFSLGSTHVIRFSKGILYRL